MQRTRDGSEVEPIFVTAKNYKTNEPLKAGFSND